MKKLTVVGITFLLALVFLGRAGVLSALFSANYLPHRFCYLAQPGLVWTNVSMDSLIAASYAVIFGCLFWIASRLRRLAAIESYLWIFIAFGIFIVACGGTHLMEVITVWYPVYPLSAAVKVVCAAASVPTAILFAKATPALAANIRRFLDMLSTTQREKEQAMLALIASEKLAVAGRISASISHEIKNPLDSAGNLLYLLAADKRIPSDLAEIAATAASELERANSIALGTLSLYRQSNAPVPVALSEIVQSTLDLQTASLVKRNISLQPRLRVSRPLKAYAGEIQQVLINLIQNAAGAIGSGGRIFIRIQPRHLPTLQSADSNRNQATDSWGQPGYSITVADTGAGIEARHRSQLFNMFFSTKGDEGTGIGLWLVRSMVEKHGGRIRFRSRTASESTRTGTVFNVWIPLDPAQIKETQLVPAAQLDIIPEYPAGNAGLPAT